MHNMPQRYPINPRGFDWQRHGDSMLACMHASAWRAFKPCLQRLHDLNRIGFACASLQCSSAHGYIWSVCEVSDFKICCQSWCVHVFLYTEALHVNSRARKATLYGKFCTHDGRFPIATGLLECTSHYSHANSTLLPKGFFS